MPLVAVLEWDKRRDGARSIARRYVERQRSVAERQLLTVFQHHVFLRLQVGGIQAGLLDKIPVRFGGHDL